MVKPPSLQADSPVDITKPPPHYQAPKPPPPEPPKAAPVGLRHTFDIDWTSPQGERFAGTFVCRVPTIKDELQIDSERERICRESGIDPASNGVGALLDIMSTLAVVLEQKPDWMRNLDQMVYFEPVRMVYREVTMHYRAFLGQPTDT